MVNGTGDSQGNLSLPCDLCYYLSESKAVECNSPSVLNSFCKVSEGLNMTEIIYLLTVLYAAYVIDEVIGDMHIFIYSTFLIMIYLIGVGV